MIRYFFFLNSRVLLFLQLNKKWHSSPSCSPHINCIVFHFLECFAISWFNISIGNLRLQILSFEIYILLFSGNLIKYFSRPNWGRRGRDKSYGSWIYNYLCNRCLSPPMLLVRICLIAGIISIDTCIPFKLK